MQFCEEWDFIPQLPLYVSVHSCHYMFQSTVATICFSPQLPLYVSFHSCHYMFHSTVATICFSPQLPLYVSVHSCHYIFQSTVATIYFSPQLPLYISVHSCHYMFHFTQTLRSYTFHILPKLAWWLLVKGWNMLLEIMYELLINKVFILTV
jgi:hypothetical protein